MVNSTSLLDDIMDVYEALNETRLTGFHYKILLTASLLYCLTALDVMLIGSVLPAIAAEWKLDKVTIGLLLSSGFVGMFFGAIIFGRLADVIGRKPTLAIVVVVESVFTALCGLAYDVNSMALLRFLAGIGLGGALPQPGVYVSEYVPAKYRGTFLGFIESSWVWGALLSLAFPIFLI
ncbi:MAG TPA: MFS transporter, partial [Thermoproteales archaeon]|nr:MFS transporter [Thermoproteales archaeon]